ncbi:MAG: hypothetical protein ABEH77_04530 [Halobacteriaceae archaeon]
MVDWERERDGIVVVVAAGVLAVFADELGAGLAVAREWGPLVLGAGALALAAALGYRSYGGANRAVPGESPRVVVESWSATDDSLAFDVANVGEGTATDLTAVVEIGGTIDARTRLRPEDGGGALGPDDDGRFECEPVFRGEVGTETVVGAYSAVREALSDLDRPSLVVAVEYADAERTRRRRVWTATGELGETLAATLENSRDAADAEGLPPE